MIYIDLLDEVKEYCDVNELSLEITINKALRSGFTTLKFGATPISAKNEKKPAEAVKTVEKVVEKIVKVSDNTKVNKLLKNIDKLEIKIGELKNGNDILHERLKKCIKEKEDNGGLDIYGEK